MEDLILFDWNLRQTIIASLVEARPDPNLIIDLLLWIPTEMDDAGGVIYTTKDFDTLTESFKTPKTIDWENCSNVVFVVDMLRSGLKGFKIPLVSAKNWRPIAQKYNQLVMAI